MPNKRSRTDSALPSRSIKKHRLTPSIEDNVPEVAIKREAEASPSASKDVPSSPLPTTLSHPLDDNAGEDTKSPEQPFPCTKCAEKLFSKNPSGDIIGPIRCIYPDEDKACSECEHLKIDCSHLIWPVRATAAEIQQMKPSQEALKATQAFSARLNATWNIYHQTDRMVWELRNINRNVFRVVNELRESTSKKPLNMGYLEDYSFAWEEAEDAENGKYE